jgi:cell fate regulator YaaT (PSP1 superfamily)
MLEDRKIGNIAKEVNEGMEIESDLELGENKVEFSAGRGAETAAVSLSTPGRLVCVRFQNAGKSYHFMVPPEMEAKTGDWVVVETAYGTQAGQVVQALCACAAAPVEGIVPGEIKPVLRLATGLDMARYQSMRERAERMMEAAHEELRTLGMEAKAVSAEFSLEGDQALVLCTGSLPNKEQGMLRQRLSGRLDCRVEIRLVGPRDHAKALGGFGVCGEQRCCSRFLTEFQAVSIRMAKDQSISMAPTDITGICGRLRCCLAYEHKVYKEASAGFPKRKAHIATSKGEARVVDWDILKGEVIVEIPPDGPREERERFRFPIEEIQQLNHGLSQAQPEPDDADSDTVE